MKKTLLVLSLSVLPWATAMPSPQKPVPQKEDAAAVKALKELAETLRGIAKKEKIHNLVDMSRQLKAHGLTFQPTLMAPEGLASKLKGCDLRIYAGMKMFDAVYAISFSRRQEASLALKSIEESIKALDLRSHADVSNRTMTTLQKAAQSPETVDIPKLLEQVSEVAAGEVPALLANKVTAHYVLDVASGFTLELYNVLNHFCVMNTDKPVNPMMEWRKKNWGPLRSRGKAILQLWNAFESKGAALGLDCPTPKRLAVIGKRVELAEAEFDGKLTRDEARKQWKEIQDQTLQIRSSILNPK